MAKITEITYAFVDSAPDTLEPGTMYISTKHRAIVHLCLCGCTEKVLLNLDPDGWSFTFDGQSISIHDSVGNIGLPCRSHYIVRRNRVQWLRPLVGVDPKAALELGRYGAEDQEVPRAKGLARWFHRRRRSSGKR
jgi:hypothetical protein